MTVRGKLLLGSALAFAAGAALYSRGHKSKSPVPTVETAPATTVVPAAPVAEPAKVQMKPAQPPTLPPDKPGLPGESEQIAAGLAYLDHIRTIPGAAPLLDAVIEELKHGDPSDFSLSNLPVDKNGFAHIDGHTSELMIKNPEVRKKWDKLMDLIAADARREAQQGH